MDKRLVIGLVVLILVIAVIGSVNTDEGVTGNGFRDWAKSFFGSNKDLIPRNPSVEERDVFESKGVIEDFERFGTDNPSGRDSRKFVEALKNAK
jgi:hypothetical protein